MASSSSDEYQAYLERRHLGFTAAEEMVFRVVAQATGEEPLARRRLVRGNDNEVYVVSTTAAAEYVVRIYRSGEVALEMEARIIEMCARAGVPAPRVYLVGREQGEELEFMVQGKVPGRPLSEIAKGLSQEEWARVSAQSGEVLGRMHSIRVGGFYHLNPDGTWDFPDWQAVMDSTLRDRGSEREWILKAGFSEADFSDMMGQLERYRREFDCPQPVLCHGDLLPEHIFVDEELRICGLVDFGMYRGDHQIHDFAVIAMETTGLDLGKMLEAHPERRSLSDRFELRLYLHRLTLEMGFLAHHMRIEHYPEIAANRRGLRETMRFLSGAEG